MRIICLILTALGLTTGCEPNYTPPPPSNNGTHVVVGDSLSWQATNYGPGEYRRVEGRNWYVYPGYGMRELEATATYLMVSNPAVLTLALGTNDAGTWDGKDGWTVDDQAAWDRVLSAKRPGTKVVIVLPHVKLGTVVTQADLLNVEAARVWLSQRPGVQLVDWRDYASAQGVLDPGGIHVTAGYEGVRYQATVAGSPL